MGFNLDDYEPVAVRLDRWIKEIKETGYQPRVLTYMMSAPGADVCVFKAELYIDGKFANEDDYTVLISTGWAEEVRGQGNVNKTSHVENCETGAVGRALANAGMAGGSLDKRPSREEMGKVVRMTTTTAAGSNVVTERPANAPSDKQLWLVKKLHKDAGKLPPHNLGSMDKYEVSRLIESLKGGDPVPPPSDNDAPEEPF